MSVLYHCKMIQTANHVLSFFYFNALSRGILYVEGHITVPRQNICEPERIRASVRHLFSADTDWPPFVLDQHGPFLVSLQRNNEVHRTANSAVL
jgi:hypothetical protein